ncbi:uncharacterized protein LOC133818845 [Humulus lupulus]|uniref:uncharacterized protein LOC133818845 n=1 Tax=Humulus lupulus TaxID=3486 RepID=UPI002B40776E|nr:uncharacterized protein LOC133818845 [Humulus lupulus]
MVANDPNVPEEEILDEANYPRRLGKQPMMVDKRDDKEKQQGRERNIQNPERYQVWLRSREKNKVLVTELDRQIAEKIEDVKEKVIRGEITALGRDDILTQALGTPEHPGRVRAGGFTATVSKMFGKKHKTMTAREEIARLKAEIEELKRHKFSTEEELAQNEEYNEENDECGYNDEGQFDEGHYYENTSDEVYRPAPNADDHFHKTEDYPFDEDDGSSIYECTHCTKHG